ncbi:hypothetical protein HOY80DRAFT_1132870 [Tuber brumale]|nr:hypothetical protein HOY80DRAFT_1132870 [Tuber brumale]
MNTDTTHVSLGSNDGTVAATTDLAIINPDTIPKYESLNTDDVQHDPERPIVDMSTGNQDIVQNQVNSSQHEIGSEKREFQPDKENEIAARNQKEHDHKGEHSEIDGIEPAGNQALSLDDTVAYKPDGGPHHQVQQINSATLRFDQEEAELTDSALGTKSSPSGATLSGDIEEDAANDEGLIALGLLCISGTTIKTTESGSQAYTVGEAKADIQMEIEFDIENNTTATHGLEISQDYRADTITHQSPEPTQSSQQLIVDSTEKPIGEDLVPSVKIPGEIVGDTGDGDGEHRPVLPAEMEFRFKENADGWGVRRIAAIGSFWLNRAAKRRAPLRIESRVENQQSPMANTTSNDHTKTRAHVDGSPGGVRFQAT